ncbi:MAG: hypothetical protein COB51_05375, partial [Moraxellaceae bacterium]
MTDGDNDCIVLFRLGINQVNVVLVFHFIGVGQAKLRKPSGEWLMLKCGDAVLLPRGHAHVLASGENVTPSPFDRFGK